MKPRSWLKSGDLDSRAVYLFVKDTFGEDDGAQTLSKMIKYITFAGKVRARDSHGEERGPWNLRWGLVLLAGRYEPSAQSHFRSRPIADRCRFDTH